MKVNLTPDQKAFIDKPFKVGGSAVKRMPQEEALSLWECLLISKIYLCEEVLRCESAFPATAPPASRRQW